MGMNEWILAVAVSTLIATLAGIGIAIAAFRRQGEAAKATALTNALTQERNDVRFDVRWERPDALTLRNHGDDAALDVTVDLYAYPDSRSPFKVFWKRESVVAHGTEILESDELLNGLNESISEWRRVAPSRGYGRIRVPVLRVSVIWKSPLGVWGEYRQELYEWTQGD